MNIASINVVPRRGNTILGGITIFIFQNGRDLEDYVEEFVDTCHSASCDDVCLMEGFRCGLDDDLRFVMPHRDPCWTLQNYINLALWMSGSTFTLGEAEEDRDLVQPHLADVSQQDPEPSPPPPRLAEPEPEPIVDGEPEPRATEPSPQGVTALENATEPEAIKSDQVREPATMPATGDVAVEREGAEDSTAHCTAEGERSLELGLLEIELDLTNFTEDSHVKFPACSEQHTGLDFPPTLPVLSPPVGAAASALPPLSPGSPTTHPQPTICAVDSPRISASALVARALGSALALRILGVALDLQLSVSASGSTSTCSAAVGRPHGVVSHSSTMAPPSVGSTVDYLRGCDLGLTWLLLLRVPSVSSLAQPPIRPTLDTSVSSLAQSSVITLDSVCCPPPGSPSSA
ncbi:hypothetical protein H4Q32_023971 [Labeo rohita]|uniref:Uncharacterized protein n=1 Tax=Labeo rohita TaxID=84645 RepID=A0ABQ8LC05_LABRO|nr:hypothetical protein H4Q32_023971 [Labeo rohita]